MTADRGNENLPLGADVSLKDVARLAGVSPATVSRVIHQPAIVAAAKLKAVRSVLERYTYIPNNAARALIKRRSQTVGLIVPTLTNPLFITGIEAIEEVLRRAGYGVLVSCSNRDVDREFEQAKTMLERGVDGIILTGSLHRADLLPLVRSKDVTVVFQDCAEVIPDVPTIGMRDADAMALAIDTLVEHGHRSIAILTGPTGDTPPVAARVRGALERLAYHGIDPGPEGVEETVDYGVTASREAVRRFLRSDRNYTAIACTGHLLSFGAVIEIRASGRAIPDDISLIGCSDSEFLQYSDPLLTTIHLPYKQMGELIAEHLLDLLRGRPITLPPLLDHYLAEGASIRTL